MRFLALIILFSFSSIAFAQKPCDYSMNVVDSTGQYRVTKDYLVYEKVFAGNSSYIFNSIAVSDGVPTLNVQFVEKSFDFIKSKCFDKNSKIYIQLENGKIVTLIHIDKESCASMVRDENGMNNRLLTGYFLFKKDDFEYLKHSPVSYIRFRFTTETADYIYKKNLNAELDGNTYQPATYFMDYFHCIEDEN